MAADLLNQGNGQEGQAAQQELQILLGGHPPPNNHRPILRDITRAMDILVRLNQICPLPLRDLALKEVARLATHLLLENQMYFSSRASKINGRDGVYILNNVEERLKIWSRNLPIRLREELLSATVNTLASTLGIGGIDTYNRTNPLPVLIASAFESLFDSSFLRCTLPSMLQWNKESRLKVLHLLHQAPTRQEPTLCYNSPKKIFQHFILKSLIFLPTGSKIPARILITF